MNSSLWRRTAFLVALALVFEVYGFDYDTTPRDEPYDADEDYRQPYVSAVANEYIGHIHSMFDAYRADTGGAGAGAGTGRLVIETNALIDTKYRTWKRNADLINSLLALPKGMNDAGR